MSWVSVIREQPALQQRVVAEIDARNDVAGMEGGLLGFGEEIVGIAIEDHLADDLKRHEFLGNEFGRVEHIKIKAIRRLLVKRLDGELEFRKVTFRDRFVEVAAMQNPDRRR